MAGQIHRQKKSRDFITIDTHCLRNKSLKWDAKGLHSYLMQLPDDWKIYISDLEERSETGRDGTRSAMNALINAGYIFRERKQGENGKFEGYDYHLFERPEHAENWKTVNGKSVNGFAVNGKSATIKNETPTELNKNEEEQTENGFSSSTFGAEKEKRRAVDLPVPAEPTHYVRTYEAHEPNISLVEPAQPPEYQRDPRAQPPAELRRVNIPDEIEALKTDDAAKETFTLSRKIPSQHFAEYVEAFRIDITGRGETYNSLKQFRSHFFNWCGTRWEIETKRRQTQQPTTGIPHGIRKL